MNFIIFWIILQKIIFLNQIFEIIPKLKDVKIYIKLWNIPRKDWTVDTSFKYNKILKHKYTFLLILLESFFT